MTWMRLATGATLAFISVLLVQPAAAENRIALVMGNSAYRDSPLRNPANDARLLAKALEETGFEVDLQIDLDQKAMKRALVRFGENLERAGADTVGLVYYAGHGVQVAGENFLVPVDAVITHERDVSIEALPAAHITQILAFAPNRLNLVILDACRNNPFARSFRSGTRGLARMEAPTGTLIAYATAPGDVAADGDGANSPYTLALAEAVREPGVAVEMVFKKTRKSVRKATKDQQTPWESSSLTGDFYFSEREAAAPSPPPAARPLAPSVGSAPTRAAADHEVVFWQSIQDSKDPATYEAFLEEFPDGPLARLAGLRLEELRGSGRNLNRKRLAFSKELDVEIFAEYHESDWCAPALSLRFEAADPGVYEQSEFDTLVAKLARLIEKECSAARTAEIRGFSRDSRVAAYTGTIRAEERWRLQR